jgi:hypothetical protein
MAERSATVVVKRFEVFHPVDDTPKRSSEVFFPIHMRLFRCNAIEVEDLRYNDVIEYNKSRFSLAELRRTAQAVPRGVVGFRG